jgi:mono/diheme cytochrome c family protein
VIRSATALGLALLLSGCEQQMANMPRYDPEEPSALFADGSSARPPVGGTVTREADLTPMPDRNPYPLNIALLQRGQERFDIFCSPCHSVAGDGDGLVARRGFPHPPTFHQDALRRAHDRHFYDVITNGYGVMYSYADRVPPADRWAIVAYIRALQLSQDARLADLPSDLRAKVEAVQ